MKKLLIVTVASLCLAGIAGAETFKMLTPLYSFGAGFGTPGTLAPGAVSYLGSGNKNMQAGCAFDPVNNMVLLVDRQLGRGNNDAYSTGAVWVLDGVTGSLANRLHETNDNGSIVVTNGNFFKEGIAVADDGAVYLCNLVNADWSPSTPFKIYRWPSSLCTTSPVVAFNSNDPQSQWFTNPPAGALLSLGLSIKARGAGPNTQIICGSRTFQNALGSNVVIFTTTDGTNFSPTLLSMNVPNDSFGNRSGCIAFGAGNTFWGKNNSAPLYHMSFDLAQSTATMLQTFTADSMVGGANWGPIAVDAANNLLSTIVYDNGPDEFRLYDISNPSAGLFLRDDQTNANSTVDTSTGYNDLRGGYLYVHDLNNGLSAYSVDTTTADPPTFVAQPSPAAKRMVLGQSAHYEVLVKNATSYQWKKNGNTITGATSAKFDLTGVTANDAATYTVTASNANGSTTSSDAVVTVANLADLYHLVPVWAAGTTNLFVTGNGGSGTPNERSIAYNARSNELYIIHRQSSSSQNFTIYGLDGTNVQSSIAPLVVKTLKTNGISGGGIGLLSIGCADDGAIYACNADSAGNWRLYRWADSGSNTLPSLVFSGDAQQPGGSGTTAHFRFGDTMSVRGSGMNTQILIDNNEAAGDTTARYAVAFTPTSPAMTSFSNTVCLDVSTFPPLSPPIIGRSLQWESFSAVTTDFNFLQRRVNATSPQSVVQSSFDYSGNGIASSNVSYTLPANTGASFYDFPHNLLFCIRTNAGAFPYYLDFYDVGDPTAPLLINSYPFPVNTAANQNVIGQITMSGNYVWALAANNGMLAFQIATGAPAAPAFLTQPQNQRVIQGGTATISVSADSQVFWYTWQKLTGITTTTVGAGPVSNTFSIYNAQFGDAASYRCIITNNYGKSTSSLATITVVDPATTYHFTQNWALASGTTNYLSGSGSATGPLERSFAYNALSNQLIILQCAVSATLFNINVVDATTGAFLYTMNTNGVEHETASLVSGSNPADLLSVAVDEGGAVYVSNLSPNAGGGAGLDTTKMHKIYRWPNSGPTAVPTKIWQGDPANQTANTRWGDVLAARGSGMGTQLLLDAKPGTFGAVLAPSDETFNTFTNAGFAENYGDGSIGRSLAFGTGSTYWLKKKGQPLEQMGYTLGNPAGAVLATYANTWPATLGGVGLDLAHNLAAGVNFMSSGTPDQLAVFEVSDLNTPMLIGSYNFPINHTANDNFISQVVFGKGKIYALNGNNGILVVNIIGPNLNVGVVSGQAVIYWPTGFGTGFTLYSAPTLTTPAASWTSEGAGTLNGSYYWVTNNLSAATKYYQLR